MYQFKTSRRRSGGRQANVAAAGALLSALLLTACGHDRGAVPETKPQESDALPLVTANDPAKAQVKFKTRPSLAPATAESALTVPSFGITYSGSDYMQLIRCRSGYRLTTSSGVDLRSETLISSVDRSELKWVWFNALAETNSCVLVGTRISRDSVQDLAAKSGEFYYVANPCVGLSSGDGAQCSYLLEVSTAVKYTNNLSAEFLALATKLAGLEATMSAKFDRLKAIAVEVQQKQDKCEGDYAKTEAGKDFKRGLGSLALIGTGAAVGGFISGGSAAILGGKAGLELAIWLFTKPRPTMSCPLVSQALAEANAVTGELAVHKTEVIQTRTRMASIESSYAKLDEEILKDL